MQKLIALLLILLLVLLHTRRVPGAMLISILATSVLAVVVEIEQVFHHCGKAFLRSQLWDPESWQPDAVPTRARIAHALERKHEPLEELERYYSPETYAAGLYPTA